MQPITKQFVKMYNEADIMASRSNQMIAWMIETLEQQSAEGNLDRNGQVHLALGKEFKEELEAYLAKPIGGE